MSGFKYQSLAMPRKILNPKIACLDFSLQRAKMHLGISVVVEDPTKLEAIRREYAILNQTLLFFYKFLEKLTL